jgi:hypothetical protein
MRGGITFALLIICTHHNRRFRNASGPSSALPRRRPATLITDLPDEQYLVTTCEEHTPYPTLWGPFTVAIVDVNSLNPGIAPMGRPPAMLHLPTWRTSWKRQTQPTSPFASPTINSPSSCSTATATAPPPSPLACTVLLNGQAVAFVFQGRAPTIPWEYRSVSPPRLAVRQAPRSWFARARHNLDAAKEERDLQRERWAI